MENNQALFIGEVIGVLAMPGPTNSLLFVSGATRGLRRALSLPLAEVGAYLISISLLLVVVAPAAAAQSTIGQLLRVVCSIYLAQMALSLWRSGGTSGGTYRLPTKDPITFGRVFVTTLLNPKNLLFAFGIFPPVEAGNSVVIASFACFSAMCIAIGSVWVAAGALLRTRAAPQAHWQWFYRGEAFILAAFAIVLLLSVYYTS